jgi:hypothetical protein
MSASMRTCFPTPYKLSAFSSSLRKSNLSATLTEANYVKILSSCSCCFDVETSKCYKIPHKPSLTLKPKSNTKKCKDTVHNQVYSVTNFDSFNDSHSKIPNTVLNVRGSGFSNYSQFAQFSSGVHGNEGVNGDDFNDDNDDGDDDGQVIEYPMNTLTTMSPPDVFPNVPVIAISRTPLFPKFMKQIVVSIKLI